jgi:hypothetical protein
MWAKEGVVEKIGDETRRGTDRGGEDFENPYLTAGMEELSMTGKLILI